MIVAFLQNMWLKPASCARYLDRYAKTMARSGPMEAEKFRREFIKRALFFRCRTGQRLEAAFGNLCDKIVWEESTREVCTNSQTIPKPQPEHIKAVLIELKPKIVLHPAARQPDTLDQLKATARAVLATP